MACCTSCQSCVMHQAFVAGVHALVDLIDDAEGGAV